MKKNWTRNEAFASFGTKPANSRWSWSARSEDGKTVVAVFWQDDFKNGGALYRSRAQTAGHRWESALGYKELIKNFAWARDHCGGEIRIIIAIAKDVNAEPRSIRECFPKPELRMRLTHFDEATGAFVAERIEG